MDINNKFRAEAPEEKKQKNKMEKGNHEIRSKKTISRTKKLVIH